MFWFKDPNVPVLEPASRLRASETGPGNERWTWPKWAPILSELTSLKFGGPALCDSEFSHLPLIITTRIDNWWPVLHRSKFLSPRIFGAHSKNWSNSSWSRIDLCWDTFYVHLVPPTKIYRVPPPILSDKVVNPSIFSQKTHRSLFFFEKLLLPPPLFPSKKTPWPLSPLFN